MNDPTESINDEASWFMGVIDTALSEHVPEGSQQEKIELEGDALNQVFLKHTVEKLIGKGGYSTVYLVKHKQTHEKFAAKYIPAHVLAQYSFQERLFREYQILKNLDHPGVIKVYDLEFRPDGSAILFMEYVDGSELRKVCNNYSVKQSLNTLKTLTGIVDYLHQHGVTHRDLKPSNIIVRKDGAIKLVDFGLAQQHATTNVDIAHADYFTTENERMGTPLYSAPELSEAGSAVAHSSDIYSLGILLYELLMGALPVGAFPYPSTVGVGNKRIDHLIHTALKKNPLERHQSAQAFGSDLDQLLGYQFKPKPEKSKLWKWIAVAASLALVAGIIVFGITPKEPAQQVFLQQTSRSSDKQVLNWLQGSSLPKTYEEEFFTAKINQFLEKSATNHAHVLSNVNTQTTADDEKARELHFTISGAADNKKLTEYLINELEKKWQDDYNHAQSEFSFLGGDGKTKLNAKEQAEAVKLLHALFSADKLLTEVQEEVKALELDSPVTARLMFDQRYSIVTTATESAIAATINQIIADKVQHYLKTRITSIQNKLIKEQQKILSLREKVKPIDTLIRDTPWGIQIYNVYMQGIPKEQESVAIRAIFTTRHTAKLMSVNFKTIMDNLEKKTFNLKQAKNQYFRMREYLGAVLLMNHRNIILSQNVINPLGNSIAKDQDI